MTFTSALLLVLLVGETRKGVTALEVGDNVCIEGFIMDLFCINRGTLLDAPSVQTLRNPEKHSVHCLVDVSQCRRSGYNLLLDPQEPGGLYARLFQLDSGGNEMVLTEARAIGDCSTCMAQGTQEFGYRATIKGTVTDMGSSSTPATLETLAVLPVGSSCQDDIFEDEDGNPTEDGTPGTGGGGGMDFVNLDDLLNDMDGINLVFDAGSLDTVFLRHGSLMLIGWGFLLPSGAIMARLFKHRPDGLWFKIHIFVQTLGLLLAGIGFIIALRNFDTFNGKDHIKGYAHAVMGTTVMVLGFLQPLNAMIRPHAPQEGAPKSTLRVIWEIVHKGSGWTAIALAVCTISIGTTLLPQMDDQRTFQLAYGLGAGLLFLFLIMYLMMDKKKFSKKMKLEETNPIMNSGEA
eukprot:CAMPEP_0198297912 /NCGR_PEP_ID=MMETSP1449-20131203/38846_1 /TAXON_ID=420275 /ORGANISM="Attheya septentrionalis, Strain CCMP2084" /LENGTH=403 /DNA_ID=CAMNT_0043999017 /DNA_START=153 /DNA_END=1364 /DNA_ORIENTATION=+